MLTMILLKIASDLGFYLTFMGFFAMLFGASPLVLLLSLLIQSVCFTASYALKDRGKVRFLPFVFLLLCFFLPGAGIADYVVIILPSVYVIWLAAKDIYEPERDRQIDIFSAYWKIFLLFIVIGLLSGKTDILSSVTVPVGTITLMCCVMLMRSLRHEKQVYCSKKYQLMNLAMVLAVAVIALLLSSKVFLAGCAAVIKGIYRVIISPILMAIIYAILAVLRVAGWLLSFIKLKRAEPEETQQLNVPGEDNLFGLENQEYTENVLFNRVLLAIGIIFAVIVAVLVFRYLSKRYGKNTDGGGSDKRYYVEPEKSKKTEPAQGTAVQRVRAQYKKFLKLCINQGIPPLKSDTSLDVNYKCSKEFDKNDTEELRNIYLEARYNGKATREDASRAKELYYHIKKTAD